MLRSLMSASAVTLLIMVGSTTAGHALDRNVRVVNNTSSTMVKFQASNTSRKSWEEDILGQEVLDPGESVRVNINDGTGYCIFDLKATFKGGATAIRRGINVCKVGTWTIND